jgi:hypothetical protein
MSVIPDHGIVSNAISSYGLKNRTGGRSPRLSKLC